MKTGHLDTSVTVNDLLEDLAGFLRAGGMGEPVLDAREIIAAVYEAPRFWPVLNRLVEVDPVTVLRARSAAGLRLKGAPLAYAVGRASFRHLMLDVDQRVLIPRPETEQLVELVLGRTAGSGGGVVIDVGTGSGAIAIALAVEGNFSRVIGTDISTGAVTLAARNVELCTPLLRAPVDMFNGSLLGPVLDVRARVVVSNPPYIALGEASALPPSVRDWEPAVALFSGADGMTATAALVRQAATVLVPGGLLAMEVDTRRAAIAAELVSRDGRFHAVRVERDLTGRERFVLARRQEREEA